MCVHPVNQNKLYGQIYHNLFVNVGCSVTGSLGTSCLNKDEIKFSMWLFQQIFMQTGELVSGLFFCFVLFFLLELF